MLRALTLARTVLHAVARAAVVATATLPLAAVPGDARPAQDGRPSFDCTAPKDGAERTICDSAALGFLDRQLAALFADLPASSPRRAEQPGWLERRDQCYVDEDCLRRAYLDRLAVLVPQPEGMPLLGNYAAARVGDGGRLIVVPRSEGLAAYIDTVTGPTYHMCLFDAVLVANDAYRDVEGRLRSLAYRHVETSDDALERCELWLALDGRSANVEVDGCRAYCGARGSLAGTFVRED